MEYVTARSIAKSRHGHHHHNNVLQQNTWNEKDRENNDARVEGSQDAEIK